MAAFAASLSGLPHCRATGRGALARVDLNVRVHHDSFSLAEAEAAVAAVSAFGMLPAATIDAVVAPLLDRHIAATCDAHRRRPTAQAPSAADHAVADMLGDIGDHFDVAADAPPPRSAVAWLPGLCREDGALRATVVAAVKGADTADFLTVLDAARAAVEHGTPGADRDVLKAFLRDLF
jgi:hypothetical protein